MNIPAMLSMWKKALRVIPTVSKKEWKALDVVSRWLISTRAAVLVMTFTSAAIAGLFVLRDVGFGNLNWLRWLLMAFALMLGHAANNLFNDYTDFVRGVDKGNYFRTMYGPQPVAHGLVTKRGSLLTFAATMGMGLVLALGLLALDGWDLTVVILAAAGLFFILFYTWPLKLFGLGEISVLLVWGPLMICGGYYAVTQRFEPMTMLAGAPYALGVTTVIFGKHIDKIEVDRKKKIHTLPVIIGEGASRVSVLAFFFIPLAIVGVLVALRYFTPVMAVVLLSIPALVRTVPPFLRPRPAKRPKDFPEGQGGWPLYFAPIAFVYTRTFGMWFLLGLVAEVVLRIVVPTFWS